jgi:hypothetical protein
MIKKLKVHIEIRFAKGVKKHTIEFVVDNLTLYEVLESMSKTEWGHDLFVLKDGELSLVSGYLMVLEKRMVQLWESKNVVLQDDQHLKFVQVVAGG